MKSLLSWLFTQPFLVREMLLSGICCPLLGFRFGVLKTVITKGRSRT